MDRKFNEGNAVKGYVYILQVSDIDLPVCKIGMSSRHPSQRCAEINNSSTGDFIWEVAYYVTVDDCRALERLVHNKLQPLKQRRREFFNLNADDAYKALLSILENQCEIKMLNFEFAQEINKYPNIENNKRVGQKQRSTRTNEKYVEMLDSFTGLLGVKGRPFGQLNKPVFGMSDGNEGVQWNIAIFTDTDTATLGVNLEGLAYSGWPIARFILNELELKGFQGLKEELINSNRVFVRFNRDAWQVTSRPYIVEQYIGGKEMSIAELGVEQWLSMLNEALGCLDEKRAYKGRSVQKVTLINRQRNGIQERMLPVSPHLNIWTRVDFDGDVKENLRKSIQTLTPVHSWISTLSL